MVRAIPDRLRSIRPQLGELVLTLFLWHASLGIFFLSLVQEYLPKELGASPAFPGYALAVYSLARFLWQPPAGWIADRVGRRPVLLVGVATAIPILVLMMQVREGHLFLLFSALYGLSAATMWPAFLARVGDTQEPSRRARTMHVLNLAQLVGLGVGTLAGVTLVGYISYESAFVACLAFNGLALLLTLRQGETLSAARELVTSEGGLLRGLRHLGSPGILLLGGIVLFLSLGTTVHTPIIGFYVNDVLHVELSQMVYMLPIPAAIAAVIVIRCRHLADRFGRQLPLMAGLGVTALSLFALTLTRSPIVAVNLAVIAGLAYAISVPAWSAAALDATEIGSRGLLLGALTAVQGLGGAMGQALGGAVNQLYGPLAPFKFGAILLGAALLLTVVQLRQERSRRPVSVPVTADPSSRPQ
jgi:MFS family permease